MSNDADPGPAAMNSDAPSHPPDAHDPAQILQSEDASTGAVLGALALSNESAVREAVRRARSASTAWASRPLAERLKVVRGAADRLLEETDTLVPLLQRECGLTRTEALALELLPAVHHAQWAALEAERCLGSVSRHPHLRPHRDLFIVQRPRGVVAVCSPWNAPLAFALRAVFDALIAGNGVVLKPSRSTPLVLRAARETLVRQGIPRDLLTIVYGGAPVGELLLNAGVDRMIFAGSEPSGRRLALQCAARFVPATLDLMGSAPGIVCHDAPLARTVAAVVAARFAHAGQRRSTLQRLYVHTRRYDEVTAALLDAVRELRPGEPQWTTTDLGPVKRSRDLDRLEAQIADAARHGATLATGGERLGNGRLYAPTLLLGCTPEMRVMHEVVVGPALAVMRVDDERAATTFASHPSPGALAYLFTDDEDRAHELAPRIPAGCIAVNDALVAEGLPDLPFGAAGRLGAGRRGGHEGLREMAHPQVLAMSPFNLPERALHWPPYSAARESAVTKLGQAMHGRFSILGSIADLW